MKMKKPSLKGMSNTKYLGRFAKDKYLQDGHNTNFDSSDLFQMMQKENPADQSGSAQEKSKEGNKTVETAAKLLPLLAAAG